MANQATVTTVDERGELIGRLKAKLKEYGTQAKTAQEERDKATRALEKLKGEYDQDALKAENDTLRAKIRTDAHKAKFELKAKEAGLRPEAIEDAWNLSGYEAKTDLPDEVKIGEVLAEQKRKRPYLFGDTTTTAAEQPNPGPARGRGGNATTTGKFVASRAQLRDPKWKHENRAAYAQSIKDGTFEIMD